MKTKGIFAIQVAEARLKVASFNRASGLLCLEPDEHSSHDPTQAFAQHRASLPPAAGTLFAQE
jgi:hypothetical protein